MGPIVIACYRPRAGKEHSLLQLVKEHVPTLRRQRLATERAACVMRSADGTIVEVFEWCSPQAVERAHTDPVVQALWERFGAVCEFGQLGKLPEAQQMFAHFEPVDT